MKHFLKGTAVVIGVTIVMMMIHIIINIVCNKNGIDLNATVETVVSTGITIIEAYAAIWIYEKWVKEEK